MNLSTIIVTWNAENHIETCLDSLFQYGPRDNKVIVVDNHSSDRTLEQVRKFPVWLIKNPANYGLGYATVQGYSKTNSDLLLVANPDIEFTGLSQLLKYAADHPKGELFMPVLYQPLGNYANAIAWRKYPHFQAFTIGNFLDRHLNHFLTRNCMRNQEFNEHGFPVSDKTQHYGLSCFLVRRSAVEKAGGIYDPRYHWAWADADFGMRYNQAGIVQHKVPEAIMRHFGGYSSRKLSSEAQSFLGANGQKLWMKRWGHSSSYFIAQLFDTVFGTIGSTIKHRRPYLSSGKIAFLRGWLS